MHVAVTRSGRLVLFLLLLPLLAGCWPSLRGDHYPRYEARQTARVSYGTIEHLRAVRLEGTKSGVGSAVGAVAGGVSGSSAGYHAGGSRGGIIGAVIGSAVGGLIGGVAEEAITRSDGVEITVRLEQSGQLIAVVQEVSPNEIYRVGDRVRVLESRGSTRVAY